MMKTERRTRSDPGSSDETPHDPSWAWAAYTPSDARPWDLKSIGHLYRRAGFGASWSQIEEARRLGPTQTIDHLLRPGPDAMAELRRFDTLEEGAIDPDTPTDETPREWWLRRMMQSPFPLQEKMTLFWHNHFAVSNVRVKSGWLVHKNIVILRTHAMGKFPSLLTALLRDPAFLYGCNAPVNRKALPNDEFARILLDQFTLGPGQADVKDVHETARALTGLAVFRKEFRFLDHEHDSKPKTLLGETGDWNDQDVARILVKAPATARHLTRRLYRWLISETTEPDDALIEPLAKSLEKDGDIGQVVETMLRSNVFFSDLAYHERIKSPVEFAIGIIRGLDGIAPTGQLGRDLMALGQGLGHPPTTKGWEGGTAWINPATILGRADLAAALVKGTDLYGKNLDPYAVARAHGVKESLDLGGFFVNLWLDGDLPDRSRKLLDDAAKGGNDANPSQACRRLVSAIAALPEFQLA